MPRCVGLQATRTYLRGSLQPPDSTSRTQTVPATPLQVGLGSGACLEHTEFTPRILYQCQAWALLWERQRGNWGLWQRKNPFHLSSRGSQGTGETVMESLMWKPTALSAGVWTQRAQPVHPDSVALVQCSALVSHLLQLTGILHLRLGTLLPKLFKNPKGYAETAAPSWVEVGSCLKDGHDPLKMTFLLDFGVIIMFSVILSTFMCCLNFYAEK